MRTDPKHFLDYSLWPILRVIWEPLSRKNAHFWHWKDLAYQPDSYLTLEADKSAGSRRQGTFKNLVETNFAWQQAVILEPENYKGKYKIGFFSSEGDKVVSQLCSVVLEGPVAVLLSPYQTSFFALAYPEDHELKLKKIGERNKWQLGKNIFLV